jgi:hypothetical protein
VRTRSWHGINRAVPSLRDSLRWGIDPGSGCRNSEYASAEEIERMEKHASAAQREWAIKPAFSRFVYVLTKVEP